MRNFFKIKRAEDVAYCEGPGFSLLYKKEKKEEKRREERGKKGCRFYIIVTESDQGLP